MRRIPYGGCCWWCYGSRGGNSLWAGDGRARRAEVRKCTLVVAPLAIRAIGSSSFIPSAPDPSFESLEPLEHVDDRPHPIPPGPADTGRVRLGHSEPMVATGIGRNGDGGGRDGVPG
ncbi:hypothetical protein LZ32DRAFT_272563 [Colletotrichum eremochloae]|nr:hypothetical protein LY78DRAFT_352130 [Colletotrichum sublineola]KAK2013095.1 hypothetical protein LZ32DRAFT_272563 [Colletotrichum eremochloae]